MALVGLLVSGLGVFGAGAGARPVGAATPRTASLRTDFGCYLPNRVVALSGSGFTPGAAYSVSVDGTPVGPGVVAPDGTVAGTLDSQGLARGVSHQRHVVAASDASESARTRFAVTRLNAAFAPRRGDPRRLRVRFVVWGLGLGAPGPVTIFVHYLAPGGRLRRTVRLGATRGACGSLPRTRPRRLFPFAPRGGRWRLQFDTRRRYRPGSRPRVVRTVVLGP